MISARLIDGMRAARWLTRERVIAGGQIMALVQATLLVMLALWQHGVITEHVSRTSSDFVSFYAAGKLALAGTPALAYDQAAHLLVEQRYMVEGASYQYFFYPPVFMLVTAPLALLPYFVAFYVFEFATLAGFLLTMRQILREPGWGWLGPVLAFPAIFWTFGLGQNAFLSATLAGWFFLLIDRRPGIAGMLLGLLCYKPHFGLLMPVGLAFGGRWRAFGAAVAAVTGLVGLTVALFGVETWRAYVTSLAGSDAVYASGRIAYAGIVTPFGAARLLGLAPPAAYAVQATVTGVMLLLTGWIWQRGVNRGPRAAATLAATLLAVPLALLYDRLLLLVAIGWLVRDGRENGFLPWEKTAYVGIWLVSLAEYPIGTVWHLPLGPFVSLAVLLMALRRGAGIAVRAGTSMEPRISRQTVTQ